MEKLSKEPKAIIALVKKKRKIINNTIISGKI